MGTSGGSQPENVVEHVAEGAWRRTSQRVFCGRVLRILGVACDACPVARPLVGWPAPMAARAARVGTARPRSIPPASRHSGLTASAGPATIGATGVDAVVCRPMDTGPVALCRLRKCDRLGTGHTGLLAGTHLVGVVDGR